MNEEHSVTQETIFQGSQHEPSVLDEENVEQVH